MRIQNLIIPENAGFDLFGFDLDEDSQTIGFVGATFNFS